MNPVSTEDSTDRSEADPYRTKNIHAWELRAGGTQSSFVCLPMSAGLAGGAGQAGQYGNKFAL